MSYDIIVSTLDLHSGNPFSMLLMTDVDFKCFQMNWNMTSINDKESACLIKILQSQMFLNKLSSVHVSQAQIEQMFSDKEE